MCWSSVWCVCGVAQLESSHTHTLHSAVGSGETEQTIPLSVFFFLWFLWINGCTADRRRCFLTVRLSHLNLLPPPSALQMLGSSAHCPPVRSFKFRLTATCSPTASLSLPLSLCLPCSPPLLLLIVTFCCILFSCTSGGGGHEQNVNGWIHGGRYTQMMTCSQQNHSSGYVRSHFHLAAVVTFIAAACL